MNNKTLARVGICFAAVALIAAPAFAQAGRGARRGGRGPAGINGHWNLTVTEGDSSGPSWLGVEQKDGKTEAQFLGRAGSVGGTENFKFADGTVTFNAQGREWTGKLEGNTIEGTWKQGDRQGKWVGKRSIARINMGGQWVFADGKGTLVLKQNKRNVSGKLTEDGKETEISDFRRMGNRVSFTADGRRFQGMVKGDVLDLKSDGKALTARRNRKWGQPIDLFNGKESDLDNWQPLGSDQFHWKVVDGIMTNGGNGTENIVTKRKDFRNFKLHIEFKVPKDGNSGVYLRGRHEIQVADSYGQPPEMHICGALYSRVAPKVNASKPAGEWQTYDIVLIDNYVTVIQNDQTILDNVRIDGITGGAIDSNEWAPGPLYLQGDHTEIFYRKVILTPAK